MAAIDKVFEKNIMEALDGSAMSFQEVEAAIRQLDRTDHVLLHMRYMKGFTDIQISIILSITAEEVGDGVKKSLENLKKIVAPSR